MQVYVLKMSAQGILRCLIVIILAWSANCRSTSEAENQQAAILAGDSQQIELHVITKREAKADRQQDYPKVRGSTFKASEPIDPNKPANEGPSALRGLFEGFDTVNKIFDPVVEEGGAHESETGAERQYPPHVGTDTNSGTHTEAKVGVITSEEEDKEPVSAEERSSVQNDQVQYAAQRPYPTASSTEEEYTSYRSYPSGSSYGTQVGPETRQVTSRRVVVRGGGDGQTETVVEVLGTEDSRPSPTQTRTYTNQRQPSNTYTYYTSGSQQQRQPSRTYSSSSQTDRRTYQSRTEARGPRYDGQVYRDNHGHYIDAQGRHLDSTGRYYDVSGRYQDAQVTNSVTYTNGGSRSGIHYASSGGSQTGFYDSNGQYVSGSGQYVPGSGQYASRGSNVPTQYTDSQSQPVDSYGGTQFYSGGSSYQTTYNPVTSRISSDPTCAETNVLVTINGLACRDAVTQLGNYVCYNYERVSEDCCESCLAVKRSGNVGCEYGDRSSECREIQPHDCYLERNKQICCERCKQIRQQMSSITTTGCEFGDKSPRCENVRQRPFLCYHPENQRTCCNSCPRLANTGRSDCQWGDQNPNLCEPFDSNRRLQLNCYIPELRRQCCSTCKSLQERIREPITGCEYGDWPILYSNGREQFTCAQYIRSFGLDNCDDPDIGQKCCYTCYRYRRSRG